MAPLDSSASGREGNRGTTALSSCGRIVAIHQIGPLLQRWLPVHENLNDRLSPKELEYPSFFQQAKNAAQAVGSVVASAVRGEAVSVPEEEQDRRLSICHACEFWDAKQSRCSKCGCFGQWKTWLATQRCPIRKW